MKTVGLPTNDDWVNRKVMGSYISLGQTENIEGLVGVGGSWVWVGGWFVFFCLGDVFVILWVWLVGVFSSWDTVRQLLTSRIACTWAYCLPF